jgi:hypothetical protein
MLHIGETQVNLGMPNANVLYFGETKMGPIIGESSSPSPSKPLEQWDRVDGKATVAGFWTDGNGQRYAVCVADAAYRSGGQYWSNKTTNTPLPNYDSDSAALAAGESATCNMDTIRGNYDLSTYPAFNSAYSKIITLDGVTYNGLLPNAAELQMIFTNREYLDTLDTSLVDYPNNSLMTWDIEDNSNFYCWTSAEYGSPGAWLLSSFGTLDISSKHVDGCGVIPIFEIPVDENGRVM